MKEIKLIETPVILKCCGTKEHSLTDCNLPSPMVAEDDDGNCYHACPVHGWFVIKADGDIEWITEHDVEYIKLLEKIKFDC